MARLTAENVETIPYGPLGIIAMPGCEALADKIDSRLLSIRVQLHFMAIREIHI